MPEAAGQGRTTTLTVSIAVPYKAARVSKIEKIEKRVAEMRDNPRSVGFSDALKVADHYFRQFGEPRISGSHHIYKTPWAGDPRINLQEDKSGDAKPYQVRQVVAAIDRLAVLKAAEAE